MRRNRFHSLVCAWAAASVVTGGCRAPTSPVRPQPAWVEANPNAPAAIAKASTPNGRPQIAIDDKAGLIATASEARVATAQVATTVLTPNETKALQARMEPLP